MPINTRENFDYENYARTVFGVEGEVIDINQDQKDLIYADAINNVHELNQKTFKGKSNKIKAVRETLNAFEGAREILGVSEEKSPEEPYQPGKLSEFLGTIHVSNQGIPAESFLGGYADQFYKTEFFELERPALQDLSKSMFQKELVGKFENIDFSEPVSEVIKQLDALSATAQTGVTPEGDDVEDEFANDPFQNRGKNALEFTKNLAIGFYNGVVNTVSGTVRGADVLINGSGVDQYVFDPETSKILKIGNDGTIGEVTQEDADNITNPEGPSTLTNIANSIQDTAAIEVDGDLSFLNKLALGAGGLASFIAGGAVGKILSGGRGGAVAATTAMGITQGGESGYQDYVNTIEATGQKFDARAAKASVAFNSLIGASEAFPVLKALDRLTADGNIPIGAFLKRIDEATGGAVSSAFHKVANSKASSVIVSGVSGAIEEGGQEIFQSMAQNFIANGILEYDPNRGFVNAETVEGGEIGGILGGFTNALFAALTPRQRGQMHEQFTQPVQESAQGATEETTTQTQTGQTTEPQAQANIQPNIRQVDNQFVASLGKRTGVGQTQDEALANLESKGVLSSLRDDDDFEIETTAGEDGVQESTITSGDNDITFLGPNAEDQLNELIENDVDGDPFTSIPKDLTVVQDGDNYLLNSGSVEVSNENLQAGLSDLNSKLKNISEEGRVFDVIPETIPEPITVPIGISGFKSGDTDIDLVNQGFTVLDNPSRAAKNRITRGGFRAYKDGFIYTVKPQKMGGVKNQGVSLEIHDLDGVKYRVPKDEVSQQYRQDSKLKTPVDQRTAENEFVDGKVGGIVLRQPARGVILTDGLIAGEQRKIIDAQSVTEVADRIGADIIFKSEDQTQIVLEDRETKESTEFAVDEEGNFSVKVDGQSVPFESGFQITNSTRSNELSASVMTRELELNGYKVTSIDEKGINLVNGNNNKVTIPRGSHPGTDVLIDGEKFKVEELSEFKNIIGLPNVDAELSANVDREFVSRPDDGEMNRNKQKTFSKLIDVSGDVSKSQVIDGEVVFENEGGIRVVMNVDGRDTLTVLEQIRTNSTTPTDFEILRDIDYRQEVLSGELLWSKEQLDNYLHLIPQEIQNIIKVHHTENNPARELGAYGYFTPSDENNNPAIHIDGNYNDRSFNTVLATLAEEVSHFGFDSWFLPEMDGLVDKMWDLVGDIAIKELPLYVADYKVNVNDPSPSHKWMLVNEFFSKQGMTFVDFDARTVALPPGVTREQLQGLKKDVDGTLQKITIDMTKDFRGNKQDGIDFIMDILRLQAGSTSNEGVHLTYKIARNDGTPATIEVRTTPYGSEKTSSLTDLRAIRIKKKAANLRASLSRYGANGVMHRLNVQLHKNVYSFIDPVIGRETSILLNAIHQPSTSEQAGILKEVKVEADQVRAILDAQGIGHVPISNSYHKTFVDAGITNARHLKKAQRMDDFMKESFSKGNQNVGSIKQQYRESKVIIGQMVENHPGAAKNLAKWRRELELQSRRFTTDWSHRTYLAYQPEGDKALQVMLRDLDPLDGRETLAAKAAKARVAIAKVEADTTLSPTAKVSKLRKQRETIDTKNRMDKLSEWAKSEALARDDGTTRLGLMRSRIIDIMTANTNYHSQSGGLSNEFISALKGRKLNENDSHDRLFMDFLGEVTDPLTVTIDNMEQQNKVMNQIMYTNKLAVAVVDKGMARPIDSKQNIDHYVDGDRAVFASENGGILNFIEVDPILSQFIKDDIEVNQALERNVLGDNFLGKLITLAKSSKTILSPKLAVSNYTSNISLLMYGGHFMHMNKYASSVKGIKSGWKQQVTFGYDKFRDESTGAMIAREMVNNNIFSGSVTSLDATLGNGQVIENTLNSFTKMLNDGGIVSKNAKIISDDLINKAFEKLKRFYSYGDEYSKVLPYLVNRQIGMAIAKAEVDRGNYTYDDAGENKYTEAVTRTGIEIAADRTTRETTTWTIAPDFIKQSVRKKINFAIGDFVLHPTQMLRIMVENKRFLVEDSKRYLKAKREGNLELARVMRNAVATRSIGNAFIDTASVVIIKGGMGAVGVAIASIYSGFVDDDEEETPTSEREDMTSDEQDGFFQISNVVNYGWGGDPMYPIARDGYVVTYYNGKRISAMNTLIPTAAPTFGDISTVDHFKDFVGNFLNISNDGIMIQMYERGWKGVDRHGNPLSDERRAEEIAKLFEPGLIKQPREVGAAIMDVIHDPTQDQGPRRGQEVLEKGSAFLGLRVIHEDIRDMVSNLGYTIKNATNSSKNTTLGDFKRRLKSGEELEIAEIAGLVTTMADNTNEVMGYVNYGVNAFHKGGLSYKEIDKYLRFNTGGIKGPGNMNATFTKNLLNGKNAFNGKIVGQLGNLLDTANKERPSNKVSQIQIDNKINALSQAIKLYKKEIKRRHGR